MNSDPPESGQHPKSRKENLARGLVSIHEARAARKKLQWMPPKFWIWAAIFIGAGIIVWWRVEDGQILTLRNELMAKQRAVAADLGPKWFPLRDKVERWTQECAESKGKEEILEREEIAKWSFRTKRGIYLRMGQSAAGDVEKIREATKRSLHDGFTACLFLIPNPSPLDGDPCSTTQNCARGLHCNEMKHCTPYAQPYNLRLAYQTMYVLSDEWVADIQQASKKLTLRGAMATFDAINKYDLPVAIELLQTARYFLVVVDDSPETEEAPDGEADGGVLFDPTIPTAPHQAQVCLFRLEDDKTLLRIRRNAAGDVVGDTPGQQSQEGWRRQANSCALALDVREAIGDDSASKVPK